MDVTAGCWTSILVSVPPRIALKARGCGILLDVCTDVQNVKGIEKMTWSEFKKRTIAVLSDHKSGLFPGDSDKGEDAHNGEVGELIEWIESKKDSNVGPFKRFWQRLKEILGNNRGECELPDHLIKEFARCLLPDILAYFESEEGQAAFEEWKSKKNDKNNQ